MRRRQVGALPVILTTEPCGLAPRRRAGQRRVGRGHLAGPGRGEVAEHVGEVAAGDRVAQAVVEHPGLVGHDGVDAVPMIALLRTDRDSAGIDDEASGPATIQATSSSATIETKTPPTSSIRRPRRRW